MLFSYVYLYDFIRVFAPLPSSRGQLSVLGNPPGTGEVCFAFGMGQNPKTGTAALLQGEFTSEWFSPHGVRFSLKGPSHQVRFAQKHYE
jgi:hypothetical protein